MEETAAPRSENQPEDPQAGPTAQESSPEPTPAAASEPTASSESGGAPAKEGEAAEPKRRTRRYGRGRDRGRCRHTELCKQGKRLDYKDIDLLRAFCRGQGRIMARQRAGTCSKCQRKVKIAIKRARFMGLLAYTEAPPRGGKPVGRAAW